MLVSFLSVLLVSPVTGRVTGAVDTDQYQRSESLWPEAKQLKSKQWVAITISQIV